MSRPFSSRHIARSPTISVFKPAGIPRCKLAEVVMTLDEYEALRLADLEGLYHDEAAARMNISRPTFSRIIDGARHKVAETLVDGKVLRIEGGPVHLSRRRCCRLRGAQEVGEP